MQSAIAVIFVFSALIIVHELGHFIFAKLNGVRVERFSIGFGRRLFGLKKGDTDYCISALPLGGYVKLAGDEPSDKLEGRRYEFLSNSVSARASIVAAGPLSNYIFGFLILTLVFMLGAPTWTSQIGDLKEGYPAKDAGLEAGDRITEIDGKEVKYWYELVEEIQPKTEGELELGVLRGERALKVRLKPKVIEVKNLLGKAERIARIGIGPSGEAIVIRYGAFESIKMAALKIKDLTILLYRVLWALVTRSISVKESLAGPIGIFAATGEAARLGFVYLLNMMAVFSVNLAVLNLLPIPVLDGGHILFLILEKIRGRSLKPRTQEIVIQAGMAALIALMVFVTYNDISKTEFFKRLFGR